MLGVKRSRDQGLRNEDLFWFQQIEKLNLAQKVNLDCLGFALLAWVVQIWVKITQG